MKIENIETHILKILKSYFIIALFVLFTSNHLLSQNWYKIDKPTINSNSGYSSFDQSISVKSDSKGNFYHVGYFEGVIAFGNDTLVSKGARDIFVCKIDKLGNYKWAVSAGGQLSDYGKDIAINSNGEVYVTGYFSGTAYFNSYKITAFGNTDIFVAKLDSSGNWLWAQNIDGDGFDRGNSIVAEGNNCYITGNFDSNVKFGSISLTSRGSKDIFVAKLNSSGNWLWAKSAGSTSSDDSYNINIDNNNQNIVITGYFSSTATFGSINLISAGSRDPFIAKLDTAGSWQWAKRIGSSNSEEITTSYIDNNNDIYVGGFYSKSFLIDTANLTTPNGKDVFLAKMNSNGLWQWVRTFNGQNDDLIYSITGDDNYIFISGGFEKNLSSGSYTINSNGVRNGYFAKMNKNGNIQYLNPIYGSTNIDALSIAIYDKKPAIVGVFYDKMYLTSDTIVSKGESDIFFIRVDSLGNYNNYKINYGLKGIIKLLSSENDKSNNIILCGYYYGNISMGNTNLISNGIKDAFIAKYSSESGFVWAKSIGSAGDDELKSIAIDSLNNYYFGGSYSDTLKLQNQTYLNSGFKDILLIKCDSNGNNLFIKTYGGADDDECNSITVIQSNIAITGTFIGQVNFSGTILNSGSLEDIYILSMTQSGNLNWAKKAGGNKSDYAYKIATDNNNYLILSGSFEDGASFGSINLTAIGGDDMFVAKLNSSGDWQWAKSIGTTNYLESANCIAIDTNNNIYIAGNYRALILVDSNYVLNNGESDVFIGKLNSSGNWLWGRGIGSGFNDYPYSISTKNYKLYLTSSYQDNIKIANKTYKNNGNISSLITVFDLDGNIINSFSETNSYSSNPINILFQKNDNFVLAGNFQSNISFSSNSISEKWSQYDNMYLVFYGIEPISNKWKVVTNTGRNSEIILPKSINPKNGNEPLSSGDAIGVFYTRNSNLYCAGYGIWNNQDLTITVNGDNLSTLIKDGMADNEKYLIKMWKESTGIESIIDVRYSSGPSSFAENTQSIISKFPFTYDTLNINLTNGWNLISSNITPYTTKMDSIFRNISSNIIIVKNKLGQSIIPAYGINNIGNWNIQQAYQVYSVGNNTLKILGEYVIPENEVISLSTGWSYISYLRKFSMNIQEALSNLNNSGKLIIAKNSSGQSFIPAYNINSIGNMIPGNGYQVYVSSDIDFSYPENTLAKQLDVAINDFSTKFIKPLIVNNPNNSTLIVESSKNYNGYEIELFNNHNDIVGTGKIVDALSIITIYGNEEIAGYDKFLEIGEQLNIRLYDNTGKFYKEIFNINLNSISNDIAVTYKNNQIYKYSLLSKQDEDVILTPIPAREHINIILKSNPNTIDYQIFNISESLIKQGQGENININDLPSGVYLLKINIDGIEYTKRFVKLD